MTSLLDNQLFKKWYIGKFRTQLQSLRKILANVIYHRAYVENIIHRFYPLQKREKPELWNVDDLLIV